MESFTAAPIWDFSQASSFSQLPDDDFLALLQKQFPSSNNDTPAAVFHSEPGVYTNGIDPQSLNRYSLPELTPPSDDSSPSPPSAHEPRSRRLSATVDSAVDADDPVLKRKASDEDLEEGPSQKNQHTGNKKNSSRRKSGGQDESRLLKRKEQNRAAQRAFRERKEKHVKDLEDKVAALEAKNDQALSENENLRDLLSRLQNENVLLKQSSFTFAVPKTGANPNEQSASPSSTNPFSPKTSVSSTIAASSRASPQPALPESMDWNSLTSFDPSMLNLLDESPQTTATDGAMSMDFGFGGQSSKTPYTTIASNPMFMSFADFDSSSNNSTSSGAGSFNFDLQSLTSWPTPPADVNATHDASSLDEMFGGSFLGSQGLVDIAALMRSPPSAISPISHAGRSPPVTTTSGSSPSSSNSNSSSGTSPFSKESPPSDPEPFVHDESKCPKTKEEAAKLIREGGASPFAPAASLLGLRKGADPTTGPMVMCQGANLPKTQQSDKNIEVLSAWRSITSNPRFKDADINELCTEFTNKARCDGTKVVLEPQGVSHILETLSSKQQLQQHRP